MIIRSKMLLALVLSACPLTLQAQQPSTGVPIAPSNVASANVQPESMPPAMAGGPPSGPRQPDHVARSPSMAAALKLARVIVAACRGYHVGVAILDAEGYPKLYYIPEGTAGFHAYMGFRKANTALKFGRPSGQVAAVTKADPQLAAKYQAEAGHNHPPGGSANRFSK